jgi:hypothetical protein
MTGRRWPSCWSGWRGPTRWAVEAATARPQHHRIGAGENAPGAIGPGAAVAGPDTRWSHGPGAGVRGGGGAGGVVGGVGGGWLSSDSALASFASSWRRCRSVWRRSKIGCPGWSSPGKRWRRFWRSGSRAKHHFAASFPSRTTARHREALRLARSASGSSAAASKPTAGGATFCRSGARSWAGVGMSRRLPGPATESDNGGHGLRDASSRHLPR